MEWTQKQTIQNKPKSNQSNQSYRKTTQNSKQGNPKQKPANQNNIHCTTCVSKEGFQLSKNLRNSN